MSYHVEETIAAVASAPGGALRGIVRISGPRVAACLDGSFRASNGSVLSHVQRAGLVEGFVELDQPLGMVPCQLYFWPSQRSYTRQPTAELHLFGSPPLLEAVLARLCASGARPAQPGEFTLRAFLAGRLDLTQAEAVLGVIDARSQEELSGALRQLAGGLAGPLGRLRDQLLDLLAHLEAGLDFVEEDIQFITPSELDKRLEEALEHVEQLLLQMRSREHTQSRLNIVLRGWPNVGKSSLLNALAGRPVAIVSEQAGTTRDVVTEPVHWQGLDLLLIDTAGYEDRLLTGDSQLSASVMATAQEMAQQESAQAHLQLLCLDATRPLNAWEQQQLKHDSADQLVVWTKTDQLADSAPRPVGLLTSSRTGRGIAELREAVIQKATGAQESSCVASTASRCRESLRRAAESLQRARQELAAGLGEELVAAELRVALDELGSVVGAVYTDDVLDRIFSRFCIGK